jgi:hypothetical protein
MISARNFPTGREEPEATRSNRRDACVFEMPCSAWVAARTKFCSESEGDPLEPRACADLVVRPDSLVARASASFLRLIVPPFSLVSSYTIDRGHLSLQHIRRIPASIHDVMDQEQHHEHIGDRLDVPMLAYQSQHQDVGNEAQRQAVAGRCQHRQQDGDQRG